MHRINTNTQDSERLTQLPVHQFQWQASEQYDVAETSQQPGSGQIFEPSIPGCSQRADHANSLHYATGVNIEHSAPFHWQNVDPNYDQSVYQHVFERNPLQGQCSSQHKEMQISHYERPVLGQTSQNFNAPVILQPDFNLTTEHQIFEQRLQQPYNANNLLHQQPVYDQTSEPLSYRQASLHPGNEQTSLCIANGQIPQQTNTRHRFPQLDFRLSDVEPRLPMLDIRPGFLIHNFGQQTPHRLSMPNSGQSLPPSDLKQSFTRPVFDYTSQNLNFDQKYPQQDQEHRTALLDTGQRLPQSGLEPSFPHLSYGQKFSQLDLGQRRPQPNLGQSEQQTGLQKSLTSSCFGKSYLNSNIRQRFSFTDFGQSLPHLNNGQRFSHTDFRKSPEYAVYEKTPEDLATRQSLLRVSLPCPLHMYPFTRKKSQETVWQYSTSDPAYGENPQSSNRQTLKQPDDKECQQPIYAQSPQSFGVRSPQEPSNAQTKQSINAQSFRSYNRKTHETMTDIESEKSVSTQNSRQLSSESLLNPNKTLSPQFSNTHSPRPFDGQGSQETTKAQSLQLLNEQIVEQSDKPSPQELDQIQSQSSQLFFPPLSDQNHQDSDDAQSHQSFHNHSPRLCDGQRLQEPDVKSQGSIKSPQLPDDRSAQEPDKTQSPLPVCALSPRSVSSQNLQDPNRTKDSPQFIESQSPQPYLAYTEELSDTLSKQPIHACMQDTQPFLSQEHHEMQHLTSHAVDAEMPILRDDQNSLKLDEELQQYHIQSLPPPACDVPQEHESSQQNPVVGEIDSPVDEQFI